MITPVINYPAVLVAGIAAFVLGMLWYSPLLFGKAWMKSSGFTEKDMKKGNMAFSMGFGFLATLVTAFVLAHFVDYTEATTWQLGLETGFWVWLGFAMPLQLGAVLWEMKSWTYFLVNTSHTLVSLLLMAAILAHWA